MTILDMSLALTKFPVRKQLVEVQSDAGLVADLCEIEKDLDHQFLEQRLAKRRRIEDHARKYVRGEHLFISSATLKGPFSAPWKNPWSADYTESDSPSMPEDIVGSRIESRRSRVLGLEPENEALPNSAGFEHVPIQLMPSKYVEQVPDTPAKGVRSVDRASTVDDSKSKGIHKWLRKKIKPRVEQAHYNAVEDTSDLDVTLNATPSRNIGTKKRAPRESAKSDKTIQRTCKLASRRPDGDMIRIVKHPNMTSPAKEASQGFRFRRKAGSGFAMESTDKYYPDHAVRNEAGTIDTGTVRDVTASIADAVDLKSQVQTRRANAKTRRGRQRGLEMFSELPLQSGHNPIAARIDATLTNLVPETGENLRDGLPLTRGTEDCSRNDVMDNPRERPVEYSDGRLGPASLMRLSPLNRQEPCDDIGRQLQLSMAQDAVQSNSPRLQEEPVFETAPEFCTQAAHVQARQALDDLIFSPNTLSTESFGRTNGSIGPAQVGDRVEDHGEAPSGKRPVRKGITLIDTPGLERMAHEISFGTATKSARKEPRKSLLKNAFRQSPSGENESRETVSPPSALPASPVRTGRRQPDVNSFTSLAENQPSMPDHQPSYLMWPDSLATQQSNPEIDINSCLKEAEKILSTADLDLDLARLIRQNGSTVSSQG